MQKAWPMKKVWAAVVVGMMVLGLSGGPASAQHGPMLGEMGRGPGMFMLLFKGAGLTPDQQTRVKAILAAHRANARDLMRQLRLAREGIVDKLFAPGAVAAGDLEPLRQQIAQLEEQLSQDRLGAALEIRALLTPDQLAKTQRLKDRVRELRTEMRALFEGTAQP
jgi:Spy/CpxP family protein refolding chaperone